MQIVLDSLFIVTLVFFLTPSRLGTQIKSSNPCLYNATGTVPTDLVNIFQEKWAEATKKLIVVTATKSRDHPNYDFLIDSLGSDTIAKVYGQLGYKLVEPVFYGEKAKAEDLRSELRTIRVGVGESLTLYVIAHGTNPTDGFYINFFDGEHDLATFTEPIAKNERIKGTVYIILDSCYSGKALQKPLPENMVILTAVTKDQPAPFMKGESATAFSFYLMKGFQEDWDCADDDHDGLLTYSEAKKYVTYQLGVADTGGQLAWNVGVHEPPESKVLGESSDEVIAFRSDKAYMVTNSWRLLSRKYLADLKERQLMFVRGNIFLKDNPNFYQKNYHGSILSGPNIEAFNESDVVIRNRLKKFEALISNDQIGLGTKALVEGDYDKSIDLLSGSITTSESPKEQEYVTLALAFRFAGKFDAALNTYDRGIAVYPESSKLRFGKAATAIFLANDATKKDSIDFFLQGAEIELSGKGEFSPDACVAVKNYLLQLNALGRAGDAKNVIDKIGELSKKYSESK